MASKIGRTHIARGKRMSPLQKEALVDFMEKHPDLRKGKFSQRFSRKSAEMQWKQLAVKLNAMGPSKNDFKHWKNRWQSIRSVVKQKASKSTTLSVIDKRIESTICTTAVEGHPGILESDVQSKISQNKLDSTLGCNVSTISFEENLSNESNGRVDCVGQHDQEQLPTLHFHTETSSKANVYDNSPVPTTSRHYKQNNRLVNTVKATEKLLELAETKTKTKEFYCNEKLKLLKKNVDIQERIAESFTNIASHNFFENLKSEL